MKSASRVLLLLLATAPALAADPAAGDPPRRTLSGADCLDPDRARSWTYVDAGELLVDAGKRKYRIDMREVCPELGTTSAVAFGGDGISQRVCGHVGDRIVTRERSCRIDRIELIDKATYDALLKDEKAAVSASAGKAD